MTNDQIRIACAECAGWKLRDGAMWYMPDGSTVASTLIPRYDTDANAALELVEKLKGEWLFIIDNGPSLEWHVEAVSEKKKIHVYAPTLPLAIAEVFLKVNGKWDESNRC